MVGSVSVLAEGPSHMTDQPGGKVVKPANKSSKALPETKPQARLSILILSKAYPSTDIT